MELNQKEIKKLDIVKKVVGKGKLKKIFRKYFGGKCVILISDKRK